MGPLPLPGSAAFLQGFQGRGSHNTDNAQKQTALGVCQGNRNREEEEWHQLSCGSGCAGSLDQMDAGG